MDWHLFKIDWKNLVSRKLVGSVGVDSGSVTIGDRRVSDQIEVSTPHGDGSYAVYAQLINGRRCVVIDFDAIVDHEDGVLRRLPPDGWKCPQCGSDEYSDGYSPKDSIKTCRCGHAQEFEHEIIKDLD